jgi:hypothetical protein
MTERCVSSFVSLSIGLPLGRLVASTEYEPAGIILPLAWNPKGTSALIVAAPATPAATSNAAAAIVMSFVKLARLLFDVQQTSDFCTVYAEIRPSESFSPLRQRWRLRQKPNLRGVHPVSRRRIKSERLCCSPLRRLL